MYRTAAPELPQVIYGFDAFAVQNTTAGKGILYNKNTEYPDSTKTQNNLLEEYIKEHDLKRQKVVVAWHPYQANHQFISTFDCEGHFEKGIEIGNQKWKSVENYYQYHKIKLLIKYVELMPDAFGLTRENNEEVTQALKQIQEKTKSEPFAAYQAVRDKTILGKPVNDYLADLLDKSPDLARNFDFYMKQANEAKFKQFPDLRDQLFEIHARGYYIIVANPFSSKWGIAHTKESKAQNLSGRLLHELVESLRKDQYYNSIYNGIEQRIADEESQRKQKAAQTAANTTDTILKPEPKLSPDTNKLEEPKSESKKSPVEVGNPSEKKDTGNFTSQLTKPELVLLNQFEENFKLISKQEEKRILFYREEKKDELIFTDNGDTLEAANSEENTYELVIERAFQKGFKELKVTAVDETEFHKFQAVLDKFNSHREPEDQIKITIPKILSQEKNEKVPTSILAP